MNTRVSLFVTCIVDQVFPQVGIAMTEVLERLGYQVDFPEAQTCCGQPAFNSGYPEEARTVARHFLDVFRDAEYIVVPSGSCTSMIAHHFEDIFAGRSEAAGRGSAACRRAFGSSRGFCWKSPASKMSARASTASSPITIAATRCANCTSRTGRGDCSAKVQGLTLREMDAAEECCGFGGTFSVKFPEVSGAMARTKIDSIHEDRSQRPWSRSIPVA